MRNYTNLKEIYGNYIKDLISDLEEGFKNELEYEVFIQDMVDLFVIRSQIEEKNISEDRELLSLYEKLKEDKKYENLVKFFEKHFSQYLPQQAKTSVQIV